MESQQGRRDRLGEVLERRRDDILRRWLEHLEEELGAGHLNRTELRDAIPDDLEGLADVLRGKAPPADDGEETWARVAREHGVARVQLGFDIRQLIREFLLLRQVLVEIAREEGIERERIFETITQYIEEAVERSVEAYVTFRDEQMRRTEAEHVAFLTHELRSPLGTAILGLGQLRELIPLSPDQERIVAIVDRSHQKLSELIEGALMLERGRAGALEAEPREVRLGSILESAATQLSPAAQAKGLHIELDYDPDLSLELDPRLTASAVHNLLDNAIKYSESGTIRVWTDVDDKSVTVHVRDNCGGIDEEDRRWLFTPFRRGRHRQPGSGQGLGLAITKEAMEAQGGSVEVEPLPGACHFCLRLPHRRQAA